MKLQVCRLAKFIILSKYKLSNFCDHGIASDVGVSFVVPLFTVVSIDKVTEPLGLGSYVVN